ncbi:MAG: hypothetical protein COV67_04125 [Nitrospinae bacterium CG11_big_fil_rev_8_21_14_0_20_56_8]|nr:MAG: hypothetical protein COV67_04125 [Nitrospinae bacterium CG11_big_fil_rev_8_21_14_0_20_56_8]
MGVYFIAAGSSTKNRNKSLDKSFSIDDLQRYISNENFERLRRSFPSERGIFLWGANRGSFRELQNVAQDEYVVDVKNRTVVQIFRYCFYIDTGNDRRLQKFIGWDGEKQLQNRRPYQWVLFLREPQVPNHEQQSKQYFQMAFNEANNSQWLIGKRWFSNDQIREALERTGNTNIEELLGIRR